MKNVIKHSLYINLHNHIIFKEITGIEATSISSNDRQKIQKNIPNEVNKNHWQRVWKGTF